MYLRTGGFRDISRGGRSVSVELRVWTTTKLLGLRFLVEIDVELATVQLSLDVALLAVIGDEEKANERLTVSLEERHDDLLEAVGLHLKSSSW